MECPKNLKKIPDILLHKKTRIFKIKNEATRCHINGWDDTQRLRARLNSREAPLGMSAVQPKTAGVK
jgi:hypothetical protein